jgi:hypothetical protein
VSPKLAKKTYFVPANTVGWAGAAVHFPKGISLAVFSGRNLLKRQRARSAMKYPG